MHISQLAVGATLKRWLKTVPRCWDGCFTEPAFTHFSCGQAGAAGRTITPESRNATQLCGLKLDPYPFDTISLSCRLVVDPSSSFFLSSLKHQYCSFFRNLLNMCLEVRPVCSVDSAQIVSLMVIGWKWLVISLCFH